MIEYFKYAAAGSFTLSGAPYTGFVNVRDGVDAFPNFTKSVLQNKIDVMKKEYERKFTDSKGVTKPLTRRNKLFNEFFFNKN